MVTAGKPPAFSWSGWLEHASRRQRPWWRTTRMSRRSPALQILMDRRSPLRSSVGGCRASQPPG
jgi:hypothetical protein